MIHSKTKRDIQGLRQYKPSVWAKVRVSVVLFPTYFNKCEYIKYHVKHIKHSSSNRLTKKKKKKNDSSYAR